MRDDKILTSSFWRPSFEQRRCLVPATSFCEPNGDVKPATWHWFAIKGDDPRPLFAFAGVWRRYKGPIKKDGPSIELEVYSFLTTTPNPLVETINHERMPVLLTTRGRVFDVAQRHAGRGHVAGAAIPTRVHAHRAGGVREGRSTGSVTMATSNRPSSPPIRKRIEFDAETYQALGLLARDSMKSLQELADEAFRDLLKKHGRPVTLKEALKASARRVPANDTVPRSVSRKRK